MNTGGGVWIFYFRSNFSSSSICLIVSSSFMLLESTGICFGVPSWIFFFIGDAFIVSFKVWRDDYLLIIFFAEEASLLDIFLIEELTEFRFYYSCRSFFFFSYSSNLRLSSSAFCLSSISCISFCCSKTFWKSSLGTNNAAFYALVSYGIGLQLREPCSVDGPDLSGLAIAILAATCA